MIKMKVLTYANARENFRSLIDQVNDDNEVIMITTSNHNAVLMSESDYNSIMETLYLHQNSANITHLKDSINQLKSGDSVRVTIDE